MAEYFDDFDNLPEAFQTVGHDGFVQQIREPAYQCMSACFLGTNAANGTLYEEGDILIWHREPNEEMRPLNKAAGQAMQKWLDSLPANEGVNITYEDMLEATTLLMSNPKFREMDDAVQISELQRKTAIGVRRKREIALGIRTLGLPAQPGAAARAAAAKAPPITNAKMVGGEQEMTLLKSQLPPGAPIRNGRGAPPAMPNTGR